MSEENVEIVRRVYAEWERGNFRTPEVFDPEVHVIWINPIFVTDSETRGIEALNRAMQEFLSTWERGTATAGEIFDGGEQVVAENVWRGRGKTSGVEVEARLWSVWTLSGARATRVVQYEDRAEAFEAAGLSE
jgi:ketosteroid isomerase-like protein